MTIAPANAGFGRRKRLHFSLNAFKSDVCADSRSKIRLLSERRWTRVSFFQLPIVPKSVALNIGRNPAGDAGTQMSGIGKCEKALWEALRVTGYCLKF